MVVDKFTDEMTEKELRGDEDGRQIEAHAQHDPSLGLEIASQEVPGASRCDAKGARQV
jgi:hypothetical protein